MKCVFGRGLVLICLLHPSSFILHPSEGAEPVVDIVIYRDPDVPSAREVKVFPGGLLPLWLEALGRPERDLKTRAALAIAEAHARGMKGTESAIPALVRELERPDQDRTVRAAIVKALVAIDARDSAAALLNAASKGEPDVRDLAEPALAKWDHKPARADWLARLDQPPAGRPAVLAIRGLGAVKDEKSAGRLREIVLAAELPAAVRLEAARALADIRTSGLEDDGRRLAADQTPGGRGERLLAASLLRNHQGDAAIRQLQALGRDSEPVVAAVALARLVEIDPKLVVPLLEPTLASPDANVRAFGVETLHRLPSDAHIRLLGDRLSDPHPDVRNQARIALRDLDSREDLRPFVRREGMRILDGVDWRGLEQSALLMGQVDHKPAAGRLVDMLNGERDEAVVAAAWALRKLAVADTLPAVLNYVQGQYDRMAKVSRTGGRAGLSENAIDLQLSQLAQFFGRSKYKPAGPLLARFIPPNPPINNMGFEARAAAAWAIGLIYEPGTEPDGVAGQFARRIAAVNPGDVEDERVRRMCAVSLGRLKASSTLPTLRQFYISKKPSLDPVNNSCGWAIEQITGEKMPPPEAVPVMQGGWFLTPAK